MTRINAAIIAGFVSVIVVSYGTSSAQELQQEGWEQLKPVEIKETDSGLQKLLKERLNVAVQEVQANLSLYRSGRATLETATDSIERYAKAGIELAESPAERIKYLELVFESAKSTERMVNEKYAVQVEPVQAMLRARGLRIEAEINLLRERQATAARAAK